MNNSQNKKIDIDALSQKLDSLESKLKQENNSFKELVLNI